jgi:hypothetical protein
MKVLSRITLVGLLALTAAVLVINVQYLYTSPVANSWVWWRADETWLMSQYFQFVRTGHYINPLAPGSAFSQCSGLLFGSCYLTAAFYGLPLLILKGHTIDAGRTLSLIFAILTLLAIWVIARRYRVGPVLRAYGCLLLAATLCFFITSHCARSDMLVGLTILMFTGCLPLIFEKPYGNRDILLGLLLPLGLLVNGHVLIVSFLMLCYLLWAAGGLTSNRSILRWAGAAAGGFACLLIAQAAMLGSVSLFGPLSGGPSMMPIAQLFHPKSDLANFNGRLVIANSWAPGVLWVSVVLAAALIWARIRYKVRLSQMEPNARRLVVCVAIVVLSSIFLEFYQPRYFIYVLPTIVLAYLIVFSYLVRTLPRAPATTVMVALGVCLAFALWRYGIDSARLGIAGETITAANRTAIAEALATIHSRRAGVDADRRRSGSSTRPRIFSTTPGQCIAMDDSCELITPVIYSQPSDITMSRSELWKRANIDYAIICNPAHGGDWNETDSNIDWVARSRARIIFERLGPFSDIGRTYDLSDLKRLDTLRVYEFQ